MKISTWTFHRKITIDSHWNYCLKFWIAGSALQFILIISTLFIVLLEGRFPPFLYVTREKQLMPLVQERTARRLLELRWRKFVNFSTPSALSRSRCTGFPTKASHRCYQCALIRSQSRAKSFRVRDPRALILSQMKLNFMRRGTKSPEKILHLLILSTL